MLSGILMFERRTRDRAIHVLSAACLSVVATALSTISLNAQRLGGVAASAQPIGGISCDAQEGQRMHIHQHLVILDHGKQVQVPFNVGQPENVPCIYWLHTHKTDGIIHVEAPLNRKFTLGEFFAIWGQPLNKTRAATAVAANTGRAASSMWINASALSYS